MFHVDNPTAVSPDFLKKIDQDPPGTWIAQPKYDGWRRCAWRVDGKWIWQSKKGSAGADVAMPANLVSELESLPLKAGVDIGLDCEWVGKRMVESVDRDRLIIFDVMTDKTFEMRLGTLYALEAFRKDQKKIGSPERDAQCVEFCGSWTNPGLFDRFQEQMTNPLSEGLVVRRADSRHLMGRNGCLTNPHVLKVKYRNIREIKHERS